jgi:signal transduction histidine kinase
MKVLLVEDNLGDARLLREMLVDESSWDATVTHVESMAEAERHLADYETDVVVLDLGLPDAMGLNAVLRAHATAPHVPLVVLTGLIDESLARQTLQQGAQDYLVKGRIEPRALWRALRYAIERVVHQRQLEQKTRELERSNADLERFAYAASHDLRSPLRAVAHLIQWIDDAVRETAGAETIDHLKLLNGRVMRLQMLLDGLLAYARVGHTDALVESLDIADVIRDVTSTLEVPAGFTVSCEGATSSIRTCRAPIQMILRNLIDNAIKHHDGLAGHVEISMRLVNRGVEIRVTDDGPGIPECFRERIFVMFQTLQSHDDIESNGIGLALVKKLVIENGGQIWVEGGSTGRGTAFVFTWNETTLPGPVVQNRPMSVLSATKDAQQFLTQ